MQNFGPAAHTHSTAHTLPACPPRALLAWRAKHAAQRVAVLTAHMAQAQALQASIRANLTQRANAGDQAAVMYLLMQGW